MNNFKMNINNPTFFIDFGKAFTEYTKLLDRFGGDANRFKNELTHDEQQRFAQLYEQIGAGRKVLHELMDLLSINSESRTVKRRTSHNARYVPVRRNESIY